MKLLLTFIILVFLSLLATLPFHYIPSYGMVFPKDNFTFEYTIINQSDIDKIIERYNNSSIIEQIAMNNEEIVRKLKEHGLIIDKNSNKQKPTNMDYQNDKDKNNDLPNETVEEKIETEFTSLDNQKLLKGLFQSEKMKDNSVLWKPNYEERSKFPISDDNYCHTEVDTILYYNDNAVVVFINYKYLNGEKEYTHYTAPPIGFAFFTKKKNNSWELNNFLKYYGEFGINGETGKNYSLEKLGKSLYSFKMRTEGGGMGEYGGDALFLSLSQENNFANCFKNIFGYQYFSKNDKEWAKTDMNIIPTNGQYYQIQLIVHSSNKKAETVENYKYDEVENKYRLVK